MISPARAAAYATVRRVFERGAYADRALLAEAKQRELDPRDRALAKQLAFGTIQRKAALDWQAQRLASRTLDPGVKAALWLGLYELQHLGTAAHAAIAQNVELAKPSPGHKVVNAVLRRVQREGAPDLPADTNPKGAAVRHSHPEWLVVDWWDRFGADEAKQLLAANNTPAELSLRINPLVDVAEDELPPGRREGDALVVEGPFDVAGSALFARGAIQPQSRAAQRVAPTLDPQPGERVLDLCAAPGGKTTHLAALMENRGTVVAVEQHPARAGALQRTADRLQATCVEVVVGAAQDYATDHKFDRILVDPPCSGLGTLRTHPDLRWRMTPELVRGLVEEQHAILAAARAALKPGGALVWSTCTISAPEELVPGGVQTFPHRDGTDGFYIAREG